MGVRPALLISAAVAAGCRMLAAGEHNSLEIQNGRVFASQAGSGDNSASDVSVFGEACLCPLYADVVPDCIVELV